MLTESLQKLTHLKIRRSFPAGRANILLVIFCVMINYGGSKLAERLSLPFWLDCIGTFIAAIQLGPAAGMIAGGACSILRGMDDFSSLYYIIVSAGVGLVVGIFFPRNRTREAFTVISTAMLAGLVSVILSTVLNIILYDGYTGNIWGDALIDMISGDIRVPLIYSILGEAFVDMPDKAFSIIIACGLIECFKRLLTRIKSISALTAVIIPLFGTFLLFHQTDTVYAADYATEYAAVTYNTDDGLDSAEINAIAQTSDGFIWAGTYSGLYRYDGSVFTKPDLDERINNVMQMYVDSHDRLWIGTNDSGIACYDPKTGQITFYTTEDGLAANAIRAICEDKNGDIYVGTVALLSVVHPDGTVETFDKWTDMSGVHSFAENEDGTIAGVSGSGTLFFIKDGRLIKKTTLHKEDGIDYRAVACDGGNHYLVGTTSSYAINITLEGERIVKGARVSFSPASFFNDLIYNADAGGFFFCCESGFGFWDGKTAQPTALTVTGFDSSISDVIVDYQGNIWFASNKQGILRYSWNPFEDIFKKAGLNASVVNSLLVRNGILYIATNDGLEAINLSSYRKESFDWLSRFEHVRIRHITEDSKGNIWVSSYGPDGLAQIAPDGDITTYNEKNGTVGGEFRLAIELSDGRIAAASVSGINFIKNGKVKQAIGEADGLSTPQILSMMERDDGSILAASDGGGIFIIRDDKVAGTIDSKNGLDTLVVLRIIKCKDGYLYVTSNAIYHDNRREIKKLSNFPYSNNYDIHITDDGIAWICSSAGIYLVRENDLLADKKDYLYVLLNRSRGFFTTLTANAWNAAEDDLLYLCCTDGVRRISTVDYNAFNDDYQIRVSSILAAGKAVPETNGTFHIPAVSGRIQIQVAVLNFTMSNPLIHIYLEGAEDTGITCYQNELKPLDYTNLPYGDYKLHVQLLDETTGEVTREESFSVEKESQLFERFYFKAYLLFVILLFFSFFVWLIRELQKHAERVRGLQQRVTTDAMTGLLNKAASESEIGRLCADGSAGVLMMLDLDSFKLVNDIYGHDMGDWILICFSELIKASIQPDDLAGRMGGDEFIAFLHGNVEEQKVADIARYINDELVLSARSYMGDDMNIPLGTSIGAVRVPDGGADFTSLYQKADKALYNVKQNGKHGYAFYRKGSASNAASEKADIASLSNLRMILGERNVDKGAYTLSFEKLGVIYRFFVRFSQAHPMHVLFVRFVIVPKGDGSSVLPADADSFFEHLTLSLGSSDIVSRNGDCEYLAILTGNKDSDRTALIEKIVAEWPQSKEYEVSFEVEDLK
ncbi:MAG: diguanylate cyclase [Lachnospiraceae bacterium]|nr:diguanylate cyclase [Lachnospiraceae bacterium]